MFKVSLVKIAIVNLFLKKAKIAPIFVIVNTFKKKAITV